MRKEEALSLLHSKIQSPNLRKHCYAVAAVMKSLAKHFDEDEAKWEITGILHDGDYEVTKDAPEKHTVLMAEWLKENGETDKELIEAILSHNFSHTGQNPPKNNLEWSLFCCDELTGFIVAVTLVRPDKKLESVTVENILGKWNSKSFAAGVKREQIEMCEEKLGIKLNDFIALALKAMQGISSELGF
jgi:putative nucleotidyltransferase with HDIG domain